MVEGSGREDREGGETVARLGSCCLQPGKTWQPPRRRCPGGSGWDLRDRPAETISVVVRPPCGTVPPARRSP